MSDSQKSTFFWPMALLSHERRNAMVLLYRYCRELDDIADERAPLDLKEKSLQKWEDNLRNQSLPIPKFNQVIEKFNLPVPELKVIIDGMRMDLENKIIIPNLQALQNYCRHVAGSVGLLAIHIFGLVNAKSQKLAILLGETLQITNILRDVSEDQTRDRLYVPTSLLKKYMDVNRSIGALITDKNFHLAWRDLAELVQKKFLEVDLLFNDIDSRKLWPARAMMLLYHQLFIKLCSAYRVNKGNALSRPKLSNFKKLWITLRCMMHCPPAIEHVDIR